MAKMLECAKVDPSSGCRHVKRCDTEEQVLRKAAEHAKERGIREAFKLHSPPISLGPARFS